MKKAVIDYNFHNYQKSFKERMNPIVESAIHFIKECADEAGGKITFNQKGTNGSLRTFPTINGILVAGVMNTPDKCELFLLNTGSTAQYPDSVLNIDVVDEYIILDLAEYLYEN